jgi:hypothetical protein
MKTEQDGEDENNMETKEGRKKRKIEQEGEEDRAERGG